MHNLVVQLVIIMMVDLHCGLGPELAYNYQIQIKIVF